MHNKHYNLSVDVHPMHHRVMESTHLVVVSKPAAFLNGDSCLYSSWHETRLDTKVE